MKTPFSLLVLTIAIVFQANLNAQQLQENSETYNLRPIRIGLKIGFPNLVGGNVEYVTPLLSDKLAVSFDYSRFRSENILSAMEEETDPESLDIQFSYLEGGLNYYLFKPGKGLYAGLSYSNLGIKGSMDDVESTQEDDKTGTGKVDFSHGSFNIKVGAKWGGLFYFRPEIGYAFNSLPKETTMTVEFEDGTSEKHDFGFSTEDSAASILFSGLIANIGFGFSF